MDHSPALPLDLSDVGPNQAVLLVREKKIVLDLIEPALGPLAFNIGPVLAKHGIVAFDESFRSTASVKSKITYIDGDAGILLYRGYAIEDLAESCSFLTICQLLWNGELPSVEDNLKYAQTIKHHTMVDTAITNFFSGFPRGSHPMAMMSSIIAGLSAFYHDSLDIHNPEHRSLSAERLIAKMPTIAAMCYKHSIGQPFMHPLNKFSYTENFLHMMFGVPAEDYVPDPLHVQALDAILVLHADHEQNASTTTVRIAGSSDADPFACMAAGISSLWGPRHGGANQAVIQMLEEIGDVKNIPALLERVKKKETTLQGFGHRVYKEFDPRSKIIKKLYQELLDKEGIDNDPLFEIAKELERVALSDDYFISRKLYPNVDFYSGLILRKLGIPTNMFTVIFAMARITGWISQWNEMISEDNAAIARPRQLYMGHTHRPIPAGYVDPLLQADIK